LLIAVESFSLHRRTQLSRENATPQAHWRQTQKYRINSAVRRANLKIEPFFTIDLRRKSLLILFQTDNI